MTPGAREVLAIESSPERLAEIVAVLAVQTAEQAAYIRALTEQVIKQDAYIRALEKALSPGFVRFPTVPRIECKTLVPGYAVWITAEQKAALEKVTP